MNIPNIRLLNQQLLNPLFREPKELVSWMGAMQAQNYSMVKWAVGMRLKSATIQTVEKALREGAVMLASLGARLITEQETLEKVKREFTASKAK